MNTKKRQPHLKNEKNTPCVLIVDDEMRSIDALTHKLEHLGIKLIKTENIEDAMKVVESDRPIDGLITDIMMDPTGLPDVSLSDTDGGLRTGVKFAEHVKQLIPQLPIIGISAAPKSVLFDRDNSPFDGFVSKVNLLDHEIYWNEVHDSFLARSLDRTSKWVRDTVEEGEVVIYETKPGLFGLDHQKFLKQRSEIQVSINDNLLRVLNGDMDRLPLLSAREFEEICAVVLNREGFDVTITAQGPDGGIDLIAISNDTIMRPVFLVQCKRNRIDRKVQVPILRDLRSVIDHHNANGGIVMTSSYFSSTAQEYADSYEYQMKLIDVLRLKSIIDRQNG